MIELGSITLVLLGRGQGSSGLPSVPPTDLESALVVRDAAMTKLYAVAKVVAASDISVLVLGETGVGKEVFAEYIHRHSARSQRPYLRLNCASLPASTLESELFGHEKGAFTGAVQAKAGLLESADQGTVFLDEIGEISPSTQAKFLRVLENGEVLRLGARQAKRLDVRIISATNQDLRARIRAGQFRSDLYFRLNGLTVTIPPLRERPDDIVPLAQFFMDRVALKRGTPPASLAYGAKRELLAHPWPGNIRELRNRIERALVFVGRDGTLEAKHLAAFDTVASVSSSHMPVAAPASSAVVVSDDTEEQGPLRGQLRTYERDRVVAALEKCLWNQTRAAQELGISRRMLITRLDTYGIARPRKRTPSR